LRGEDGVPLAVNKTTEKSGCRKAAVRGDIYNIGQKPPHPDPLRNTIGRGEREKELVLIVRGRRMRHDRLARKSPLTPYIKGGMWGLRGFLSFRGAAHFLE
jgi:hypothetical protein